MAKRQTRKKATTPASKSTSPKKRQQKTAAKTNAAGKKEKITLIERLIKVLQNQLKKLKRRNSPVRDEYRYNIDTQHMNYVYLVEKNGDKETYHSLGFTHHDTYEGKKNMPLQKNPKKGDDKASYIRNGEIEGTKNNYSRKKAKNYQLTGDDKANAKSKIRHHKKERKKKKCKKN
jgi:hypothetical protein